MKKTVLILAALFLTVVSYSQKKELRDASKEIKSGSFEQAKKILSSIEGQINSADDALKAEFYLYKGQAYLGSAGNNQEDLMTSVDAFKKVSEIEGNSKQKYSKEAEEQVQGLIVRLVNTAIQDQSAKKYSDASKKLYAGYTISKVDTVYLYFAAINALQAQEYENAMSYYEELYNLGFTGIENEFVATNRETGEIEVFANKEEQNLMMMSGNYVRPQERMSESKRPSILRDLGVLYIENGKIDEAKQMIANARKEDPNDVELIKAEANIALRMDDMKKYNELMKQVVASDPENPELFYNLGVSAASIGDNENAMDYYKRAIELDPNYTNAHVNIAVLILDREGVLIEEMNSLGTSAKDNKRYDELIEMRNQMYREALPYLENASKQRSNDANILRTLMNIYSILGEDTKFKEMKSRLEAIEE